MNKMFWNILRDHVFRFLLNLLIIALPDTRIKILNLLLLSLKHQTLLIIRSAHSRLTWLCHGFCLFVSFWRLHWLWFLGGLWLDKNRFYLDTVFLPL
jgi:hypothetical protein